MAADTTSNQSAIASTNQLADATHLSAKQIDRASVHLVAIDDDNFVLRSLSRSLEKAGYKPIPIDNGETALEMVTDQTAVVLLGLEMPGISGVECLRFFQEHHPNIRVIVLTGSNDVQDAVDEMREGAFEYIRKPFDPAELIVQVDKAVQAHQFRCENENLRQSPSKNGPARLSPSSEISSTILPTNAAVASPNANANGLETIALGAMTLEEIERCAIQATLKACDGNKAKTARTLGISEKSVYNKMRRLGINWKRKKA